MDFEKFVKHPKHSNTTNKRNTIYSSTHDLDKHGNVVHICDINLYT